MYIEPLAVDKIEAVTVGTTAVTVKTDGKICRLQNAGQDDCRVEFNGKTAELSHGFLLMANAKTDPFIASELSFICEKSSIVNIIYFK